MHTTASITKMIKQDGVKKLFRNRWEDISQTGYKMLLYLTVHAKFDFQTSAIDSAV